MESAVMSVLLISTVDAPSMMKMNDSFKSFVQYPEHKRSVSSDVRGEDILPLRLLDGEIECTVSDNVSFCFQFQPVVSGSLTCTNFCLHFHPTFIPNDFVRSPRRSTVIDEQFSIPLCSIESIYYSSVYQDLALSASKKKYRRLTSSLSSLDIVSCIKIYLKDFRVLSLDMTRSQHAPNLANQLLFFSRPSSIEHVAQAGSRCEWNQRVAFNDKESWNQELSRVGAGSEWRVCNVRVDLARCSIASYPSYVVVPRDVSNHDLSQMVEHWNGGRFPVWVWSHGNGTSLVRSSQFDENWNSAGLNKEYLSAISKVHRTDPPQQIVVDTSLSVDNIASSFRKLHKMCTIDSYEMFTIREKDWLSRLGEAGWLRLVTSCLQLSSQTITWMLDRNRTVVLYEDEGMDITCVVSSLVQICCDPYFRNSGGLDHLISKDWLALGHPFGQRLLGIGTVSSESTAVLPTTPTFLLFLDCVAQLIRLYPMQFNYSEHLLIALWDLSLTGCVPGLACSSVDEQLSSGKAGGPFPLARFYTDPYRRLFSNVVNDSAQLLQQANTTLRRTGFSRDSSHPLLCDVIRPPTSAIDVELWSACYMRFVPPANVTNGGTLQRDMALDGVMTRLAGRSNLYWKSPFNSDSSLNTSAAYPYSQPDSLQGRRNISSILDNSDALSESSFASISIRDKRPRASIPFDSSPRVLNKPGKMTRASLDVSSPIELRTSEQSVKFTATPVRPAPMPPPRKENHLRPNY